MKQTFLLSLFFCPFFLQAQFGPGGVGNSSDNSLWLRADARTSTNNNLSPISFWEDDSGNGNHVSQSNPNQQPLFLANFANGYAGILFDNNSSANQNDFLFGADSPTLDDCEGLSIFSITRRNHLGDARSIVAKRVQVGIEQAFMFFFWTNNFLSADIVSNNDRFDSNPERFELNQNRILNLFFDGSLAENQRSSIYEGERLIKTARERSDRIPRYNSPLIVGATHVGDNRAFGGVIGEVIIFRRAVRPSERIIINNYLSAKYNIPLNQNDLYTMDNPSNGDFDHEVAGIGRLSANDQHTDAQGKGLVRIQNPRDLDNGEFLFWGHNQGIAQAVEFSDLPSGLQGRFERVWRVSERNINGNLADVGGIDLIFDLSNLGPVNPADLRLLVDVNQNGLFFDDPSIGGAVDLGQNRYAFLNITQINDGVRFTIGTTNINQTPLPLDLLSWSGQCEQGKPVFNWELSRESVLRAEDLRLETSETGLEWRDLGALPLAQGPQRLGLDWGGTAAYYRLVYEGGEREYSPVIHINCASDKALDWRVFPNPSSGIYQVDNLPLGKTYLQVFDALGRPLRQYLPNETSFELDLRDLPSGLYQLILDVEGQRAVKTLQKY